MKKINSLQTFYVIIFTQILSQIGSRISGLAMGIWVFNETGNALPLAIIAFLTIIPQVILGSVAGVFADRYDRRYVMALSDAGQAIGTLLLLALFVSGNFQLWHLYMVSAVQALFGVFQAPAFNASITMLIPDNQRDRANAIQQMTSPAAGIIAPIMAGLVFAFVGVVGAIVIDLVSFLIAVLVILSVHIPMPRKTIEDNSPSIWREALMGFQYLWEHKPLLGVVMSAMVINFLLSGTSALTTPYILARVESEAIYGMILALLNVGMLVGSIAVGVVGTPTKKRMTTIIASIGLLGFTFVFFGMAQTPIILGIAAFVMLLPNAFTNAPFMSILQAKVAPNLQGRVFATLMQLSMFATPIGYLVFGYLADNVFEPMVGTPQWALFAPFVGTDAGAGMGLILAVCGILGVGVSIVMALIPSFRNIETVLPDYVPLSREDKDTTVDLSPTPATA